MLRIVYGKAIGRASFAREWNGLSERRDVGVAVV
jgi:hypothetical protein